MSKVMGGDVVDGGDKNKPGEIKHIIYEVSLAAVISNFS